MVLNFHKNRKAQGRGEGRRGREVKEEGEYIPIATLSPPDDSCIKMRVAMRVILMFH